MKLVEEVMTPEQQKVKEFMLEFGQTVRNTPEVPAPVQKSIELYGGGEHEFNELGDEAELRIGLIYEEVNELEEALLADTPSPADVADALGDLLYVIYGAAVTWGIDMEPIFNEIHRSNMTKKWEDGTVHYNDEGKVIKPPTYSKANLEPIIKKLQEIG